MNFRRSLLLWALVLGSIGGLIYWDSVQTVKDEKAKEEKGKIFQEEFSNIAEFHLLSTSDEGAKTDISGAKSDAGWALTSLGGVKGDSTQIESMIKGMLDYKFDREITDNSTSSSQYGLDAPTAKLTLKTKDGKELVLQVGAKTPVGYSSYVSTNLNQKILLGSQHIHMSLKKTAKDLRDKTLVDLSEVDLTRMSVNNFKDSFKFEISRMNENLTVKVGSQQDKADSKKITSLLNALKDNKVEDFNDEPTSKLLDGIKKSKEGFHLNWISSKDTKLDITVGKVDGKVWAVKSDSKTTYNLPEKIISDFTVSYFDLRDKSVVTFSSNELASTTIDGKSFNRAEDGKWTDADGKEPEIDLAGLVVDLSFLSPTDIAVFKDKEKRITQTNSLELKFKADQASKDGKFTIFEEKAKDKTHIWVRYQPSQPTESSSGVAEKLFEAAPSLLNNLKPKQSPPADGTNTDANAVPPLPEGLEQAVPESGP